MSDALALVALVVGLLGCWRYRRELFANRDDLDALRRHRRQRRALGRAATAQRDD